MGKIAIELQEALARRTREGARGETRARTLATGEGWAIRDVLCTFGPRDRPFEERHGGVCIAMIVAGSFGYRAAAGRELLTPGSLLLGNAGECFECGHRHGAGDRCVSVSYTRPYFGQLAADLGIRGSERVFRQVRVPPLRALTPCVVRACAGASGSLQAPWDEFAVELAARTLSVVSEHRRSASLPTAVASSRVAQTARMIDDAPHEAHTLHSLACAAGMSEFHFLRTFQRVTGVTPHQYVLRARIRAAALRLVDDTAKIVDVALDCGFNDVSNFNHAFRAEFGVSPRAYRSGAQRV
ncbi:helix-turn-helix transcriptional regulator [Paraburkholderia saeva]|uniref:helix-turn-helix transcriptional regulator n=1 Tax=Paraburkholderia saeva TaxID=2777537 RepID=UPI001DB7C7A8|nr:AraC family transcriptional regulator [Paraburkholderia saeva]CAG4896550.1 HTH-type transcriptional activator RhaS [Paraburkholderia saeva]